MPDNSLNPLDNQRLSEWAHDKLDSAKDFVKPKPSLPPTAQNSFYNRVKDFFYWADQQNSDLKPQRKVAKATGLITAAQIFSLPGVIIGYVIGGPLGALTGIFKPKNANKPRIQEIKDRTSDGIQVTTRLASILPTSWIAMGLAYLGQRYITAVTPFESESNGTLEKSFAMANLILRHGQMPLKYKNNSNASLTPKNEIITPTFVTEESSSAILEKHINQLHFSPSSSVGESANDLIQSFLESKKTEFKAIIDKVPLDPEIAKDVFHSIEDLRQILKEAENGNILPLRDIVLETMGNEVPWGIQADFELVPELIPDVNVNLVAKNTPITRKWLKASFQEKEDTPRYDHYQNSRTKEFSLTTAGPNMQRSQETFLQTPYLNCIENFDGIAYQKIVRWSNDPIPDALECFPTLAEAVESNILPYHDQEAPLASVAKNISPDYTYDNNVFTKTQGPNPQNIMVIELPHLSAKSELTLQEFSKLSWQIASAELNAVEATFESEYEAADRYPLQPIGIEKSPEQLFLRAALFLTEAALRLLPVTLPENSPQEFFFALDVVQAHIIPEIQSGSDRERILDVLSDAAAQLKSLQELPPEESI